MIWRLMARVSGLVHFNSPTEILSKTDKNFPSEICPLKVAQIIMLKIRTFVLYAKPCDLRNYENARFLIK